MFPQITVDLNKIALNTQNIKNLCDKYGVNITAITKAVVGDRLIAETLYNNGITALGDSRVENIMNYSDLGVEKWLIRMPYESEISNVIKYCDVSLNSEISTLSMLNDEAIRQNKIHQVVIMYDLGDLREGYIDEAELESCISFVNSCKGLSLKGLGTNLACFSVVQPDNNNLNHLVSLAHKFNADKCVSGGNSANLYLMLHEGFPKGVNNLRLGESVLFGRERSHYSYLPGMYNDAFRLKVQIIECKIKPSYPIGTIGKDSYGRTHTFIDRGNRKRVICAIGKQDIDSEIMWPLDEKIEILGASSDHLMLDVTASDFDYHVGDIVEFRLGYFSVMRAFTSKYVEKIYL